MINSINDFQVVLETFLSENEEELKKIKAIEKGGPWFDTGSQLCSRAVNHISVAKKELSKIYDAVPRAKRKK